MSAAKKSKSIKIVRNGEAIAAAVLPPAPPPPGPEDPIVQAKQTKDFIFPKMPGPFRPTIIRKLPMDKLRGRYITVLSASMGNHSLALFYCCWTQEQFDAAMNPRFRRQIEIAKSQLADRATFIMHRNLGLIEGEVGAGNSQVTSVLSKVIENLRAKEADQDTGGGFKLVVEGLDRSQAAPAEKKS